MEVIYLDNAATTFPKPPEVIKAVNDCLNHYAVNPQRGHNSLVKRANEAVALARGSVASLFGANPDQLAFVPSATFGVNLVMQGTPMTKERFIYISPYEHNAVVRCAEHLRRTQGVKWLQLPIDRNMHLDVEGMRRSFEHAPPGLVVVTHASNVTGDLLPIKPIIELSRSYGAKVLVDAAQTVGCYTPNLHEYGYDYLVFSSHKGLYGIPGAGGVIFRDTAQTLAPLIYGGTGVGSEDLGMPTTLPDRFEAGTVPLPTIASMHAGVEWLKTIGLDRVKCKQERLRSLLSEELQDVYGVSVRGTIATGNVGTVAITTDSYRPQELNMALDNKGICVRSGLHCAPLAHRALGTFPQGVVRVSFSWFSEECHVRTLIQCVQDLLDLG